MKDLFRSLLKNFPGFSYDDDEAEAWAAWVADMDRESVERAAMGLLATPPHRFPNGPEVRRRVLADAGLLAPPFEVALKWAEAAARGERSWESLSAAVRGIDLFALRAGAHKLDAKAVYEYAAEAADRDVLLPGGYGPALAAARVRDEALAFPGEPLEFGGDEFDRPPPRREIPPNVRAALNGASKNGSGL